MSREGTPVSRPIVPIRFARLLDLRREGGPAVPAADHRPEDEPPQADDAEPGLFAQGTAPARPRVARVARHAQPEDRQPPPDPPEMAAKVDALAPSVAVDKAGPPWITALVDHLLRGCPPPEIAPAGFAFDVPLDPQALPDSRLRITASPETIELRFTTTSAADSGLLWTHRDALHQAVAGSVGALLSIHIEID